MALAKKCDVCGVFFEHDVTVKHNAMRFCKTTSTGIASDYDVKDCCPKCIHDIEECLEKCKNRPVVRECQ